MTEQRRLIVGAQRRLRGRTIVVFDRDRRLRPAAVIGITRVNALKRAGRAQR